MISPPDLPPLLGEAPAFLDMLAQVSRVAPLERPVLVVGERGTGKELVAARLNYLSPRSPTTSTGRSSGATRETCASMSRNAGASPRRGGRSGEEIMVGI